MMKVYIMTSIFSVMKKSRELRTNRDKKNDSLIKGKNCYTTLRNHRRYITLKWMSLTMGFRLIFHYSGPGTAMPRIWDHSELEICLTNMAIVKRWGNWGNVKLHYFECTVELSWVNSYQELVDSINSGDWWIGISMRSKKCNSSYWANEFVL